MPELDLTTLAAERARLRATYLRTGAARTPTTARGAHHVALLWKIRVGIEESAENRLSPYGRDLKRGNIWQQTTRQ